MGFSDNLKWVGLSQVFKMGAQVATIFILARFMPPEEIGLMAMVTVVTNFANIFRDLGLSSAVIQNQKLGIKEESAVFAFSVLVGFGVMFFIMGMAPLAAIYFSEERLLGILLAISLTFPLISSASVHQALMEKASRFEEIAKIEIFCSIFGFVCALTLAASGAGVYSLVSQLIAYAISSTLLIWFFSKWTPSIKGVPFKSGVSSILGFSGNISAFNLINYLSRNADGLIIGRYLGAATLGAYSLAYRLMLFPLQGITLVASRSYYPIFSKNQEDKGFLLSEYLVLIKGISIIVFPLMFGLVAVREDFVPIVFGDGWNLTSDLLFWLAPTAVLQAIVSTTGLVFMSTGNSRKLLLLSIFNALTQVSAFYMGSKIGIVTLALLYFFANAINFIPNVKAAINLLGGGMGMVAKSIAPSFICTVLMFFSLMAIKFYILDDVDQYLRLFSMVLIGVISYLAAVRFLFKSDWDFFNPYRSKG